MGIPKFYRWISERYPCLSEKIREYQIPEFDNLYLDMNGIIHSCSHPNDEDIHLRIPEEAIFRDIFRYIDFLFKMIKPRKVFFMAIDGVAPRAKMNQQRGRRFRSARLAEEQENEAVRKGEKLPDEERFDSNCITPGTEFMARLHEHLKYFVQVKISTDPLWQQEGVVIYLSGHDVPGEGEHKIMDFIRHIRSKPDYNPETRHCLYGLDADLIMLGLSTHELRFSLLREEVKFSKPKKNKKPSTGKPLAVQAINYDGSNVSVFTNEDATSVLNPPRPAINATGSSLTEGLTFADQAKAVPKPAEKPIISAEEAAKLQFERSLVPVAQSDEKLNAKGVYRAPLPEKTTFLLLHLSLLRDYIDEEFQGLRRNLESHPTLKYDLEKVIDDWILMSILVGNDFVPNLPHLHIVKGALPMLYQTYMNILPSLDGYLNESGVLNLRRFEVFIQKLSQFDLQVFRDTYDDMKYMESKTGKNIVLGEKMFEDYEFTDGGFEEEALEESLSPELQALVKRTTETIYGETTGDGILCADAFSDGEDFFEEDDSSDFRSEFFLYKKNYYMSKLEVPEVNKKIVLDFAKEYVRAIQWVLLYYYKGVSSWGWFYPSHYGPFASDLKHFGDYCIEFDKGTPFKPFQQLLAVLPAQSKKLLPQCYQWLMTEETSPILEFYPEKFQQDLNGKKQDWEAVVLIPFIDESKLLEAMDNEASKLNVKESHRNSRGTMHCYSYAKENTGPVLPPANSFPTLPESHIKTVTMEDVPYNDALLPRGIHPKAKVDQIYQGFPTLKSIPHKSSFEKAEIKIFDFVARDESLILDLSDLEDKEAEAAKLLGKPIWVNWPHLGFALITAVGTKQGKFTQQRNQIIKDPDYNEKLFDSTVKGLIERHLKFKGIRLGKLNVIVWAKVMEGRKVRCESSGNVSFDTQWSKIEHPYSLKTAIHEDTVKEIFYLDRDMAKSYKDLFAVGERVFHIGENLFGAFGVVMGHDEKNTSVLVEFNQPHYKDEGNIQGVTGLGRLDSQQFFSSPKAAAKCQISSYVLSRLTGTILVAVEKEQKVKKGWSPKKDAKRSIKKNGLNIGPLSDSGSDEEFPALEKRKVNVGLELKFNRKNLEVRGYTRRIDQQWYYSAKAIQLVNEYVSRFTEFVQYMTRVENKDVFQAADIFPQNSKAKVGEIIDWLDSCGVRDLSKIPTNTEILDDDDIDRVWTHIVDTKVTNIISTPKIKTSVKANLLFKPGLNRGCVAPIPATTFEMLDRVVCVDQGAPIALGQRGTVVGIHKPQKDSPEQSEEMFKSTSTTNLQTLFILCDPLPDVFDKSEECLSSSKLKNCAIEKDGTGDLTSALASLLGIRTDDSNIGLGLQVSPALTSTTISSSNERPKPRLVKLYPFQVINLSQGLSDRCSYKEKYAPPRNHSRSMQPLMKNVRENERGYQPVRILARPQQSTSKTGSEEKTISNFMPRAMPPFNKMSHSGERNVQPATSIHPLALSGAIKTQQPPAQKRNAPPFLRHSNEHVYGQNDIRTGQRILNGLSNVGSTTTSYESENNRAVEINQFPQRHPFPKAIQLRPPQSEGKLLSLPKPFPVGTNTQSELNSQPQGRGFVVEDNNPFSVFLRPMLSSLVQVQTINDSPSGPQQRTGIITQPRPVTMTITQPRPQPVTMTITQPRPQPVTMTFTQPVTMTITQPRSQPVTMTITQPRPQPVTMIITQPRPQLVTTTITQPGIQQILTHPIPQLPQFPSNYNIPKEKYQTVTTNHTRLPPPPPHWVGQQKHHQQLRPMPQYHGAQITSSNSNRAFVPLQVDIARACHRGHGQTGRHHDSRPQTLPQPKPLIPGLVGPPAPVMMTEIPVNKDARPRKSRIAANFGVAL